MATATERRRRRWRRSPRRTALQLLFERMDRASDRRLAEWRARPKSPQTQALLAWWQAYLSGVPMSELPELPMSELPELVL